MPSRGVTGYCSELLRGIPPRRVGCIRVAHPCAGRRRVSLPALPLDLHVLSLPPAFILSQDQTLHCIFYNLSPPSFDGRMFRSNSRRSFPFIVNVCGIALCCCFLFPFVSKEPFFQSPSFRLGSAKVPPFSFPPNFFVVFFSTPASIRCDRVGCPAKIFSPNAVQPHSPTPGNAENGRFSTGFAIPVSRFPTGDFRIDAYTGLYRRHETIGFCSPKSTGIVCTETCGTKYGKPVAVSQRHCPAHRTPRDNLNCCLQKLPPRHC